MKKKFLSGIAALSLIYGVSSCAPIIHSYKPNVQVKNVQYENNNNTVKNANLEKLVNGVELITVTTEYCTDLDKCKEAKWFGTGFVYKKGKDFDYLMTAGHVAIPEETIFDYTTKELYSLKSIKIEIKDKNISLEKVVGELNNNLDYAILKTKTNEKLKQMHAFVGDSKSLECGDYLYIVGHPLAMGINYTEGILSAKEHIPPKFLNIKPVSEEFIFSTPISPGNSGSPIFAIKSGKFYLIGIAVATYLRGQNLNIGVKINSILKDAKLKTKKPKVEKPEF